MNLHMSTPGVVLEPHYPAKPIVITVKVEDLFYGNA